MSADLQPIVWEENFVGAALHPDLATTIDGSATATMGGGKITLALEATNEAQNVCLYMGDKLPFDIDDIDKVEIWAAVSAALAANESVAFGAISARHDNLNSIAEGIFFRIDGNATPTLAVLLESDDGTNDLSKALNVSIVAATVTKFVLNFRDGLQSRVGVNSLGGKASVQAAIDDARGNLRRVDPGAHMDLSNYSGGLQVFAQIQKSSGTSAKTLAIHRLRVHYKKKG